MFREVYGPLLLDEGYHIHVWDIDPVDAQVTAEYERDLSSMFRQCAAAIILTPPSSHLEIALHAARHVDRVLVEKPIACRLREWSALSSSEQSLLRKKVRYVESWAHNDVWQTAAHLVETMGGPRFCSIEIPGAGPGPVVDSNWRLNPAISGGGAIFDWGIHSIGLAQMFFQSAPRRNELLHGVVAGPGESPLGGAIPHRVDLGALILLEFEYGYAMVSSEWSPETLKAKSEGPSLRVEARHGRLEVETDRAEDGRKRYKISTRRYGSTDVERHVLVPPRHGSFRNALRECLAGGDGWSTSIGFGLSALSVAEQTWDSLIEGASA